MYQVRGVRDQIPIDGGADAGEVASPDNALIVVVRDVDRPIDLIVGCSEGVCGVAEGELGAWLASGVVESCV